MQDRVLNAAHILIDREPIIGFSVKRAKAGMRRTITREIPTGIDKSIASIGLAARRLLAARTVDVFPGGMVIERISWLLNVTSSGSLSGKSFSGTGRAPQASQWIIGIGQPQ